MRGQPPILATNARCDRAVGISNPATLRLANVWLGVTAEDQQRADERIPLLLQCPAAVRFVSVEPMIGPVDFAVDAPTCELSQPSDARTPRLTHRLSGDSRWVICGGESGPGARPMHPEWARSLRDQCKAAGVPFLFKQWGEWAPAEEANPFPWTNGTLMASVRVGKREAGRLLDGVTHDGYPEVGR